MVEVRVPAKVNLQLSVGGPGSDGYHDIATVFQAVSVYDHVRAEPAEGVSLTVEGSAEVPSGADNLAVRAAESLAEYADVACDVAITLRKEIPVAAGMAGGSADAAAALLACDALWGLSTPRDELASLAGDLGADVPFALLGGTALGTGRGDRLTPVLAAGHYNWVFAVSDSSLSTPRVYEELDRLREGSVLPEPAVADRLLTAVRRGDAVELGKCLRNDMERAAVSLRPQLQLVLEVAEEYGALGAIVSGSGPTVACLARDEEQALDLAVALTASGVCPKVLRATGPVAGARLI